MVCVECLPAVKPWDVVPATRLSSGVASRACVRMYARVLVLSNIYIHAYIHLAILQKRAQRAAPRTQSQSITNQSVEGLHRVIKVLVAALRLRPMTALGG